MQIIRPSADLRNKYAEVSKQAKEEQQPIFITVNGRGDSVLLNQAMYERLMSELELLRLLAEADQDVRSSQVIEAKQAFDVIKQGL